MQETESPSVSPRGESTPAPSGKASRRRLLLLGGGLCLGLALGEGVLRVAFPAGLTGPFDDARLWPWMAFDPVVSWRNRPGYRDNERQIRIDRLGLRVAEAIPNEPSQPAAGASGGDRPLRVLCLGDSRTFGVWADRNAFRHDNDWPRYLDSARRGLGVERPIESWNAGTVGQTTAHGLRQWMTRLRHLDPDAVVVGFGFNDHAAAWNSRYRVREPSSPLARGLFYAALRWRLVELALWQWRRPPFSESHIVDRPWVTPAEYRHNLERFAEEGRRRGVPVLFLDLPLRDLARGESLPAFADSPEPVQYELFGANDLEHLHAIENELRAVLREVGARQGVPVVDVEAFFARRLAQHPDEELFGSYDMVHPTVAGARAIADAVVEKLRDIDAYP